MNSLYWIEKAHRFSFVNIIYLSSTAHHRNLFTFHCAPQKSLYATLHTTEISLRYAAHHRNFLIGYQHRSVMALVSFEHWSSMNFRQLWAKQCSYPSEMLKLTSCDVWNHAPSTYLIPLHWYSTYSPALLLVPKTHLLAYCGTAGRTPEARGRRTPK